MATGNKFSCRADIEILMLFVQNLHWEFENLSLSFSYPSSSVTHPISLYIALKNVLGYQIGGDQETCLSYVN